MPSTGSADLELRRRWRAWAEVVGAFAARRGRARRIAPADYEAMHRALVGACEARARAAGRLDRNYYEGLGELARPWLTKQALVRADGDLLWALAEQVRQIDRELNGRARATPGRPHLAGAPARPTVALLALVGAVVAGGLLGGAGDWLGGWASQAWGALRDLTLVQKLLATGVVAAAVGWWLVSSTRRI